MKAIETGARIWDHNWDLIGRGQWDAAAQTVDISGNRDLSDRIIKASQAQRNVYMTVETPQGRISGILYEMTDKRLDGGGSRVTLTFA